MKHSPVYWLTCLLTILALVPAAMATTIIMPSDEALIAKTPLIVTATVVSSEPVDRGGKIWTETILSLERTLKGNAPAAITVREIGGILGDRITKIWGTPEYAAGERVLAFLTPTPRGDYQTMDLFVGKFSEAQTLDGEKLWFRDDTDVDHVTLLDGTMQPSAPSAVQRDAAAFERFIEARTGGRFTAPRDYEIQNPVIDRPALHDSPSGSHTRDNFTLISEPTVYRWFTFDNGGTANWYSYGTQPGYTGGGVNEIQTAMDVWNGYTSAKISYTYVGAQNSAPGGLDAPNGRNEVLFNDPLNEISGSWNPATGGVVGEGGFNGVSGTATWNAPFTADASHQQGSYRAYNITEANLTVQDNVSPTQGISSRILAEIVAHEFGHTLGLGHSADSTALMAPTLAGLGPSLRADDQLAARWLYPNGNQTPPSSSAPAAPSNLTATASSTSINLQWMDNSTNENGFYVYMVPSNGAFSLIGSVAAGRTGATLSGIAAGTYRLYVTAYNSIGESAASNTVTAVVYGSPITPAVSAAFDFSPSNPQTGNVVTFTDRSSGSPTQWSWSFGDGATSQSQNPTHAFAAPGTYTVTLSVANNVSTNAISHTITVSSMVVPFRSLVSVTAQVNGAGGSVWRTELTVFNAGSDATSVTLTLLPASGAVQARNVFLSPRQAVTYSNVLFDLFGISSGSGALAIEGTSPASTPALRVSSRTFTNSPAGTYGQAVPDVASSDLKQTLYLTGLESDASYRTNIGVVNRSSSNVPVTLKLVGAGGNTIATANLTVGPNTFRQDSLATFFPAANGGSYGVLSMRADTGTASAISVYASVVDNRSQDPVYVQGAAIAATSQFIIPSVGHTAGANGTFWRSDLTLFNTSSSRINVYARYFVAGADNRNVARKTISVAGGQTVVIADLLTSLGFASSGVGALELTWDGSVAPVVFSRTYTTNSAGGTYGQSVDAVSTYGRDAYVVGLRSDFGYRSNAGFVNSGDATIGVNLTLLSANGQPIANGFVALAPKSQFQASIGSLFPGVNVANLGTFTLQAHTDAAATLFAYGSIVDNASGDPVFFAGE